MNNTVKVLPKKQIDDKIKEAHDLDDWIIEGINMGLEEVASSGSSKIFIIKMLMRVDEQGSLKFSDTEIDDLSNIQIDKIIEMLMDAGYYKVEDKVSEHDRKRYLRVDLS